MAKQSLRECFKIDERNSARVSRIIRDVLEAKLIEEEDPEKTSRKYAKYIYSWALSYLMT